MAARSFRFLAIVAAIIVLCLALCLITLKSGMTLHTARLPATSSRLQEQPVLCGDATRDLRQVKALGVKPPHARSLVPPSINCHAILNIFTSCIDNSTDHRKRLAQRQVLESYHRLQRFGVQAWLFTESEQWASQAAQLGVHVVRRFDTNQWGSPCLSFMYKYVANATQAHCDSHDVTYDGIRFDAYVNCDIIFTRGLVNTLEEVSRRWRTALATGKRGGILIVGKRTNVDFHRELLRDDNEVVSFAKRGKLYYHFAQDYFIYSRNARDWNRMPHFVIGRRAYDNWLVTNSYTDDRIDLIDGSNTILALHLTCADGNSAGHAKMYDNDHNVKALNPQTKLSVGPHEWNHGSTDDAHFFTTIRNGTIRFVRRTHTAGSRSVPAPPPPPPVG